MKAKKKTNSIRKWSAAAILAISLAGPSLAQSSDTALTSANMLANGDAANALGRYEEALKWYRTAADRGDASAQARIGEMYELGRGVPEDMGQAMIWYRKAADQNDAQAQLAIGILYSAGWGVKRDQEQALIWYRKSADQGNAVAAESMGTAYTNGLGVKPDFLQARFWYDKAIDAGDTSAIVPLCGVYSEAWARVSFSDDANAMDNVIAKIDPRCVDLIKAANMRSSDVRKRGDSLPKPRP